jgi:hypothetical protein
LKWVTGNRPQILRSLLTLVRAWVVAAEPAPQGIPPFGGFDRWARAVGGVLQHAGFSKFFQDPQHAYTDPEAEQWLPFLLAVREVTYGDEFTVADVVKIARDVQWVGVRNVPSNNASKLRDHLPDELAKEVDTAKFGAELGYAFRKRKNTYYGLENIHIVNTGKQTRDGAVLWQVRQGNQAEPSASRPSTRSPSSAAPSASSASPGSGGAPSSVPPAVGTIRRKNGMPYRFDGSNWVIQHD